MVDSVAGRQVVVEADLLAVRSGGQVDEPNMGTPAHQERLEPFECLSHRSLGHHVGVEGDGDQPIVERDRLPVRESDLAAVLVSTAPVPDAEQSYAAQTGRHSGVGLADALGDP